jgi:hypothetical protein
MKEAFATEQANIRILFDLHIDPHAVEKIEIEWADVLILDYVGRCGASLGLRRSHKQERKMSLSFCLS